MKPMLLVVLILSFVATAQSQPGSSTWGASPDLGVAPQRKSPALAVFYSLLLPGMGELYAGGFSQGRYSLIAEGGLWLTYGAFQEYGNWLRDDGRAFARTHSGLDPAGKSDQFFIDASNFDDMYQYNVKKMRDRDYEKVYDPAEGYFWRWDDGGNRAQFRSMRVSSERSYNNSRFVIAAIIVNHVVSAVNAARLARAWNQEHAAMSSWWLESSLSGPAGKPDGFLVTFVAQF